MNHWAYDYIGIKWVNGGRDIKTGVDCWGLLHHIYKHHYHIELPLFNGIDATDNLNIAKMINNNKQEWLECNRAVEGCAVAMSKNKILHHVGIFVCGMVIHALGNDKVIAQSLSALKASGWSTIRFFKHEQMT